MRIAILSDTHDRLPLAIPRRFLGADEIWHLGDVCAPATLHPLTRLAIPLRVMRGNCDSCPEWPLELRLKLEGFRIFLTHIPPSVPPAEVDLLFHGHTHVPRNERVGLTRFFNPGCITRPNRGAPASWAWLTLERGAEPVWELQSCG